MLLAGEMSKAESQLDDTSSPLTVSSSFGSLHYHP